MKRNLSVIPILSSWSSWSSVLRDLTEMAPLCSQGVAAPVRTRLARQRLTVSCPPSISEQWDRLCISSRILKVKLCLCLYHNQQVTSQSPSTWQCCTGDSLGQAPSPPWTETRPCRQTYLSDCLLFVYVSEHSFSTLPPNYCALNESEIPSVRYELQKLLSPFPWPHQRGGEWWDWRWSECPAPPEFLVFCLRTGHNQHRHDSRRWDWWLRTFHSISVRAPTSVSTWTDWSGLSRFSLNKYLVHLSRF